MARHLRVFAAVRAEGPSPFADIPRRFVGLIEYAFIQTKMFKDPRAGLMHAGIFWGFVLLTIGTANIVTGGLIEQVLSIPFDGLLWALISAMQNVVAVIVLVSIAWAFLRRLVTKPRRLTFNRDALVILAMIGGVVATELLAEVFEFAAHGDQPGAFVSAALAGPLRAAFSPETLEARFAVLVVGAHRARRRVPRATCRSASTSTSRRASRTSGSASSRRAASCRRWTSRTRTRRSGSRRSRTSAGRTCSTASPAPSAAAASRPARPGTPASRSTPRPSSWASGTCRSRPSTASTSSRTRRSCARRTGSTTRRPAATALAKPIVDDAIPYDAVWDCVTCGACVEACPVLIEHVDKIVGLRRNLVLEESRFPQELTAAFRAMEGQGNPWGQPASTRTRLDEAAAVRGADGRVDGGRRRLDELEVLYWVGCAAAFDPRNQKVARAVATCLHAAGVSFAILGQEESCTGDPARRMGNDYVFQILASAERRDAQPLRDGGADDRDGVPALLQHDRQRVRPARRRVPSRPPLDVPGRAGRVGPAGDAARGRRRRRPATIGRAASPSTTRATSPATTASSRRRATCSARRACRSPRWTRAGKNTFCCGAGGGRMWMEETRGTRINEERTRQVLETGAVDRRHRLPVLHGDDERRPRRGRRRCGRHARWTSARSSPRGSRRCRTSGGCRWCEVDADAASGTRWSPGCWPTARRPTATRAARGGRSARPRSRPTGRSSRCS